MSSPSEPPPADRAMVSQGPAREQGRFPQVPPPPTAAAAAVGQRLHPAALGVWALSGVRPLLLLVIAGSFNIYVGMVFVVVAAVSAVARWLRFSWRLDADALVIEKGVIERQRRVIPLERIQSVEVVRKLGHRVFGVVELRVESIGGGSTEGQLDALDPDVARQLRGALLRKGAAHAGQAEPRALSPEPGADGPAQADPPLVRMRPGTLAVAGLTGGRVGVFAAILGFASQAFGDRVDDAVNWTLGFAGGTDASGLLTVALVVGATAFAIAFVLAVIATVLTFWDFTLTMDRRNLYTSRGLLDQRSGTIPLHRVQSIRIEENLARRALGLAAVKVEVAGHAGSNAAQETTTVLPLGKHAEALQLVATIMDEPSAASATLSPMPQGARDRRLVRAAFATVVLTAPAVWWFGPPGLAALAVAAPLSILALASYRALGHAEPEDYLIARSGVVVRRMFFTRERALQAVSVTTTPFQRRRGLATLTLHIARSAGGGGDPAVTDVTEQHARTELWRLAAASDASARRPRATAADGPMVRPERPEDADGVRALHAAAGAARAGAAAWPAHDCELSLVAEEDGEIVAHAPLSALTMEDGRHGDAARAADGGTPLTPDGGGVSTPRDDWTASRPADHRRREARAHLLGPLAIREDHRDSGLDATMVKAALAASAQRGAHRLVAADDPAVLEPLGFAPLEAHGMQPPDASGSWQVRLLPADDGTATGRVRAPF